MSDTVDSSNSANASTRSGTVAPIDSDTPMRAALGHELAAAAYAIKLMAPQHIGVSKPSGKDLRAGEEPIQRLQEALKLAQQWAELPNESFPATQELAYSAIRQLGLTGRIVGLLAQRPPGTYTLHFLQVVLTQLMGAVRPAAIVVDQAVSMALEVPDLEGQSGFINGLLRQFLRKKDSLIAQAKVHPEALHNFPQWWQDRLIKAWGEPEAIRVMATAQTPPPFTLRINQQWGGAAQYSKLIKESGLQSEPVHNDIVVGSAALITKPCPVGYLPGFAEGWASVQDLAAQLAAQLLDVQPEHHVLDACAAPGGKTTHLLEYKPARLVAADVEPARLAKVKENLQRYQSWGGMDVELLRADLKKYGPGNRAIFDRILLDAPCSASGIVRRHPDIRWVRKRGDLATLVAEQKALLASLWLSLKPGGKLLYATCSIFPEENDDVVRAFVDRTSDAQWISLSAPFDGLRLAPGRSMSLRLLPSDGVISDDSQSIDAQTTFAHDGFYLALLQKQG